MINTICEPISDLELFKLDYRRRIVALRRKSVERKTQLPIILEVGTDGRIYHKGLEQEVIPLGPLDLLLVDEKMFSASDTAQINFDFVNQDVFFEYVMENAPEGANAFVVNRKRYIFRDVNMKNIRREQKYFPIQFYKIGNI